MSVSNSLRRLLGIRELQEEQSKLALESAIGELHRLELALQTSFERGRRGRNLIHASAQSGQLTDRLAGLEETRAVKLHVAALEPRVDAKAEEIEELRNAYLSKRVERRQAEAQIQESEAREAVEADRRGQQSIDDWHNLRKFRDSGE